MAKLELKNLHVALEDGTPIVKGVDLTISSGEVHAIMGPNGSGKSTLSHVIVGRPGYEVLGGTVTLDGVDVLALPAWERAHAGLFLAMQYPTEVPGVSLQDMLTASFLAAGRDPVEMVALVGAEAERIGFDERFLTRELNVDLSGGEKKRNETLQLGVLAPKIAILDELDSGLDVDALRACARRVEAATHEDNLGVLAITHYNRLLTELKPDVVHILVKGRLRATGGPELADTLETTGYAAWLDDDDEVDGEDLALAASRPPDPLDDPFGPGPMQA